MNKPARNDLCACGCGKKYKKCCLPRDEAQRAGDAQREEHFITELRPDLDEAVDRALQRLDRGEGNQVEPEIAQLLERFPDYHMTNYAMGIYHATVEKDWPAAIHFLEKAVAIFPLFPEAHFNLGMVSRQACDILKSVEAFRAAERYSRDDEIAGMARKELEWFEKILLEDGVFQSLDAFVANAKLFNRAFQGLCDRRFGEAVELFERVLSENPKHVQSWGNLALACAGLGRRSDALACFDRALELDPDYEPAISNRRVTEKMREGEPFIAEAIRQVEFYADRLRTASGFGNRAPGP
jgi:tetratricopeptide (TPR) repeat protein